MAAERPRSLRVEDDLPRQIAKLEQEMLAAAKNLEFEKAAELRDAIAYLKKREMGLAS
jgi:excinuclease ABC subunit B